jgi:glycosyltransferase involved in cell wall biosynthesis
MKIAILTEKFPPNFVGGGEISTYYLAKELSHMGHKVEVFTQYSEEVSNFNFNFKVNLVKSLNFSSKLKTALEIPLIERAVIRLRKNHIKQLKQFDVIHASCMRSTLLLSNLNSLKNKSVSTIRDCWPFCGARHPYLDNFEMCYSCSPKNWARCKPLNKFNSINRVFFGVIEFLNLKYRQRSLNKIKKIIPISNFLAHEIIHRLSLRDLTVIGNSIPNDWFQVPVRNPGGKNSNILYVAGTISEEKGALFLLEALNKLKQNGTNFKATFIGKDPNDKFKKIAYKLGLSVNIHFTGRINFNSIKKYYISSDIVVSPSLVAEGFGRTILEGMSLGKPVIGTKLGGTSDLIDNEVNGFLVPPGDVNYLYKKIKLIFENKELRNVMGSQSRQKAKRKFTTKAISRKYINIYKSVIEQ